MSIAIVTGSLGLVGSAAVRQFSSLGLQVVGIDNDMRSYFFGKEASTAWLRSELEDEISGYKHYSIDIRSEDEVLNVFKEYGSDIRVIIHCAAQPSHDWAAREPVTDFSVNASGTLNLLEATRKACSQSVFIHCSTNKLYGDLVNNLPLVEHPKRYELSPEHPYSQYGVDEQMSIDQSKHSLMGISKLAADLMVQEYARYFGMKTVVFRGGCLSGSAHSGAALHGFLAYLMRCVITDTPYVISGYGGKQVRDNIHCDDLVRCFCEFYKHPRPGEVYNIGGGRHSNCSVLEAIDLCEQISGKRLRRTFDEKVRVGDHIWWISDVRKFKQHYPDWSYRYSLEGLMSELHEGLRKRLAARR